MLSLAQINDRIPTVSKSQAAPFTNDQKKSTKTQTSLVDEQPPPLTNAVSAMNATIESRLESVYSCDAIGNLGVALNPESTSWLLGHAEAGKTSKGQPNDSSTSDKTIVSDRSTQLSDIIAAPDDIGSPLSDDNSNPPRSLDRQIEVMIQKYTLRCDDSLDVSAVLLLSDSLLRRATMLDSAPDMNYGIECLSKASRVIGEDHTLRVHLLNSLVTAHRRRFLRYGDASDINKAVEYRHQTIMSTGDKHACYALFTAELGSMLGMRYQALGRLDDLQKSIECQNWALAFISEAHDGRAVVLNNLGNSYACRFQRLGEPEDINMGIEYLTESIQITPNGDLEMFYQFNNLGNLRSGGRQQSD
ncbi:hypothetical protein BDV93DRAFT_590166 [Ceratobasidium sp. AG-I]|nr:hypothetical protein BDV93DRAFT_590166 [Ceratobasidium sp. AG-I]